MGLAEPYLGFAEPYLGLAEPYLGLAETFLVWAETSLVRPNHFWIFEVQQKCPGALVSKNNNFRHESLF